MSLARIKETFVRLPKQIKFIGIGALVLAISTFLPWYADLDSYRIGDEFLGITGPASFVGIIILLLSGLSLWIFSYRLLERRVPRLPVREGILNLFVAIESLFLLILVNSIFFHPKFGVNITLKESRFGMTIAFIGAAVLLFGAYLQNREEIKKDQEVGRLEPLIKMEQAATQTVQQKTEQPAHQRQHTPVKPSEPRRLFPYAKETTRGFLFGEPAVKAEQKPEIQSPPQAGEKSEKDNQSGSGSYMFRMGK